MPNIVIMDGVEAMLDVTPPIWRPWSDRALTGTFLSSVISICSCTVAIELEATALRLRVCVPATCRDLQAMRDELAARIAQAWADLHGWRTFTRTGDKRGEVHVVCNSDGEPEHRNG